ncbi:MAG: peptide deformylase [Candidatus Paceibacterota bacterium]
MRTILPHENNPVLREKAQEIPVADIGSTAIRDLISDMKTLLAKEEHGVALAASQLGEPLRLFIVSGRALARGSRTAPDESSEALAEEDSGPPPLPDQVYINPELVKMSQKRADKHEGCLSIRGKWGMVPRAEKATVRAYNENGTRFTRGASGFLAHIFQHEMDHLGGTLYTDKATELYEDDPDEK